MQRKEFGLIFWLHLIIILAIYSSPFWLSWKIVILFVLLYYFQLWFLGNCLLTKWEFDEVKRDTTFYSHYLSKLGLNFDKRKLKLFLDYFMPWAILAVALIYQLLL